MFWGLGLRDFCFQATKHTCSWSHTLGLPEFLSPSLSPALPSLQPISTENPSVSDFVSFWSWGACLTVLWTELSTSIKSSKRSALVASGLSVLLCSLCVETGPPYVTQVSRTCSAAKRSLELVLLPSRPPSQPEITTVSCHSQRPGKEILAEKMMTAANHIRPEPTGRRGFLPNT